MPPAHSPLSEAIAHELPSLRRYARAIHGSQPQGDAAVRNMLEALLANPARASSDRPTRIDLFRLFHETWTWQEPGFAEGIPPGIGTLPLAARAALLLQMVERFRPDEIANILHQPVEHVERLITAARDSLSQSLRSRVMIIEDEPVISMHLEDIVESLGNEVVGVARTRREAVALAHQTAPEVVLADISLADGSSGIDAVADILADHDVPVVFITAFPERLLTGEKLEPAYLITKPFEAETVAATIWQMLLVHREQARARMAEAEQPAASRPTPA
ncbi:MAG: response regulator [Novosphingobium sp.]